MSRNSICVTFWWRRRRHRRSLSRYKESNPIHGDKGQYNHLIMIHCHSPPRHLPVMWQNISWPVSEERTWCHPVHFNWMFSIELNWIAVKQQFAFGNRWKLLQKCNKVRMLAWDGFSPSLITANVQKCLMWTAKLFLTVFPEILPASFCWLCSPLARFKLKEH